MIIGVIGTGRVGTILAAALRSAGHEVVAATRVSPLLPEVEPLPAEDVARAATDLLLIAVPDDALAGVVARLAAARAFGPGQIVVHTSGAQGLGVLRPATALGARPLALHPVMTFTGAVQDLARLRGISFGVTAPEDLRALATRIVADLGGFPEWIGEGRRVMYHASLAHSANHLVTLVNDAADRLRDAGVVRPERVLRPLLEAALDNALRMGDNALTGPVSRGDAGTVARHVEALRDTPSLTTYLALARRTADRAIASGRLRATDAEALLDGLAAVNQTVGAAR
ncbi:MAG TPA: DUF2520 domain-containing protein [Candidatus Limnocylindrales bacterium]|nr:DUF2520 domain-containing protein [Candidatus Limnocylindrales bacterium]